MFIGIPRETLPGERRVAALPDTVQSMVQSGFTIGVEAGAGRGQFRCRRSIRRGRR